MSEPNTGQQAPGVIPVSREALPFSCPTAGTDPAALHPRVFIPLKKSGDILACPYCGARYQL